MSDPEGLSFGERKAWALRQGNPLWLWPEVAPRDWRAAMVEVERICTALLAGNRADALSGDPAAVALAGYTSGMGPMLGWWLEQGLLSASCVAIESALERQFHANGARMAMLLGSAREVAQLLTGKCIGVTVLKGMHTAWGYFPRAACRPMSDIDILIAPADAAAAEAVLEAAGYQQVARTRFESTWRLGGVAVDPLTTVSLEADDPWTLDLHVSLDVTGPPGSSRARLSELDPAAGREAWDLLPGAVRLAQPALLLHLAAHAGSGFHNLTLVRLVEIVLVARADRAGGTLDWDEFAELGRATGSLAFAYPALELARRLSPAAIPQALVERCAAEAPPAVRRLVAGMRPATAHGIDRPSLREHFAWTRGPGGWLRRLAADLVPEPGSLRRSAAIHAGRARGLLRAASRSRATPPRP
jgi:hypothetical protein